MPKAKVINTAHPSKNLSIRNKGNINFSARTIAHDFNHGSATVNRIVTVLNDLRYEQNIRNLSQISADTINQYAEELQDRLHDDSLSPKTVVNYISTINMIVRYIDKSDLAVSARELGIHKGSAIAAVDRSVSEKTHQAFQDYLSSHATKDVRYEALRKSVELQRSLGLRARESFAIKADTIKDALRTGTLSLSKIDMTKSYRPRDIKIVSSQQKNLLQQTHAFMKENGWHSLINPNQTLQSHSGWAYRQVLSFQKTEKGAGYHFHSERHAYAQSRYSSLWEEKAGVRIEAPVKASGNWQEYASSKTGLLSQKIKEIDKEIRLVVSAELGHNRISITRAYLG